MRLKHLALAALPAMLCSTPALARDDEQLWLATNANVKLSSRWQLSEEVIARFSDNRGGLYEIEWASLLGYKIGKSVTVAAGYLHNPQYSDGELTAMERRGREQITIDNVAQIGLGKVSVRMRMEQRHRDHVDGTAWRVRPYVKYSMPFRKGGATSLTLSSEAFVNVKNTSFQKTEGLDRMRNLIAINQKLSPKVAVEAGYLNQYTFVRGGDDGVDHTASIALSLSL